MLGIAQNRRNEVDAGLDREDVTGQQNSASTAALTPVVIDVLANDSDPDNDALTISGSTQAGNGLVVCALLNCTYTPNLGFAGSDSFTYTIADGNGGSDSATVTVSVA